MGEPLPFFPVEKTPPHSHPHRRDKRKPTEGRKNTREKTRTRSSRSPHVLQRLVARGAREVAPGPRAASPEALETHRSGSPHSNKERS
jgi:hypothetical protein